MTSVLTLDPSLSHPWTRAPTLRCQPWQPVRVQGSCGLRVAEDGSQAILGPSLGTPKTGPKKPGHTMGGHVMPTYHGFFPSLETRVLSDQHPVGRSTGKLLLRFTLEFLGFQACIQCMSPPVTWYKLLKEAPKLCVPHCVAINGLVIWQCVMEKSGCLNQ